MTSATRMVGPLREVFAEPIGEPMSSRAIPWSGFHSLVNTVTDAGGDAGREFADLTSSFAELQVLAVGDGRHWQRRLAQAILRGDRGDDLGTLFASALAERSATGSELQASLLAEIRDQVLSAVRDLYGPHARGNYIALRDQFNRAAEKFVDCADRVDPNANADSVILGGPKLVTAWRDAETHAERLDQLLEPLCCAAELVRPLDAASGLGSDRSPFLISLCCDPGDLHRRVVWAAWHDSAEPKPVGPQLTKESLAPPPPHRATRGGRWTRLWAAGCQIAAIDDPTDLQPYRGPGSYGARPSGPRGKLVRFDPEGDLPDPTEAPRRGRLARLRDTLARRRTETEPEPNILDTFLDTD